MAGDAVELTRAQLATVLRRVHRHLAAHRDEVDDLNVFPVPDGDTGTNMTLTLRATVESLDEIADDTAPDEHVRTLSRAAMRGARGNSGVILSQVLRAFIEQVVDEDPLTVTGYAAVWTRARDLAYEAVADPVEGTILTAISAAADAATRARDDRSDLPTASARTLEAVTAAVARTEELLEANRDAGVVDAGARGFELVVAALHGHLTGEELPDGPASHQVRRRGGSVGEREAGSLEYRFEVQYLLAAGPDATAPLRDALRRLGDSVVVVEGGGLLSVHVHTNDIGPAIEAGLEHGRPTDVCVTYFLDQNAEPRPDLERVARRCVAVLPDGPLHELARSQDALPLPGSAGALPSVAELADAIAAAEADSVIVLPGHPNAVPTARRAIEDRPSGAPPVALVEEAASVPAVLAALAVCDVTQSDPDGIDVMRGAAAAVIGGEVVAAVRDADTPVGRVREGQLLSIVDGDVVAVNADPLDALRDLIAAVDADPEMVTLVTSDDVPDGERDKACSLVQDLLPDAELELVDGGPRTARYVIGLE